MLKNHKFYLNTIWLILLFTVPLPLIITLSNGLDTLYINSKISINFGIFAYVWMLVAIYLATRPKWLDKILGLPDMYIIHGMTAIFGLALMWLHNLGLQAGGFAGLTGEWSLYIFTAIVAYSLIFMAGWLTSRVTILARIKNSLNKIFKHELSVWIHRLNVVAVLLAYVHILLIDYIVEIKPFIYFASIYTIFVFVSYIYYLLKHSKFLNVGKIKEIIVVDNVTQIVIAGKKEDIHKIKAGEFIFISFPNRKSMRELHPFSVVNDPQKDGVIVLGTDAVGDFTKELKNLVVGEKVTYSDGYGVLNKMIADLPKNEKIVFIAGGIGATSLTSLAGSFSEKDITFIYTVRDDRQLIYGNYLEDLASTSNISYFGQKGRLTEEQIEKLLPISSNCSYIIAGPMAMNISYTKYLTSKGIKKNKIFFESFAF